MRPSMSASTERVLYHGCLVQVSECAFARAGELVTLAASESAYRLIVPLRGALVVQSPDDLNGETVADPTHVLLTASANVAVTPLTTEGSRALVITFGVDVVADVAGGDLSG